MDTISVVQKKTDQQIISYSWTQYYDLVQRLVALIRKSGKKYESVYGIPRAGVLVAVMLSYQLNLRYVETSGITKKTLLVDEIADSGKTLRFLTATHTGCDTAVLSLRHSCSFKPTFFVEKISSDAWIEYPYEKS